MTEQEIKQALAELDTNHPFWRAIQALLAEAVEQEQAAAAQPDSTDGARHFNAGRLAHALDFQTALNALKRGPVSP